jgi:hypothetical protein
MNQTIIEIPDPKVIESEHSGLLAAMSAHKVTDLASHGNGLELLKRATARKKAIHDRLDPLCEQAFKIHKGMTSLRGDLLAPIENAERAIKRELDHYEVEEAARREAEQKRRDEQARAEEENRRINEAVQAEAEGDKGAAEEILQAPVDVEAAPVAPALAKVEGASSRTVYGAEVVDLMALVKHVVAHPEDLALLTPHMPSINARARSQREGFKLPGCKLKKDVSRSFRKVE